MNTKSIRLRCIASALVVTATTVAMAAAERDTDGDGLSDFAETHKYLTDPARKDTDGDGTPDGDAAERREYSYSIRTVIRVMKPIDAAAMNDDYQDARLLRETEESGEFEVTHYPLNTVGEAITVNPRWQLDYAGMEEWLKPGVTTNWTADTRRELLQKLTAAGIDPSSLNDRDLAKQVSRWLVQNVGSPGYMFTTYFIDFANDRPSLLGGCARAFEREKGTMGWTFDEQLQHEVLGAGMLKNLTRGTCTSSAVCWTTAFRALGLPARQILCIPAVDPNAPDQLALIQKGITHHQVRTTILTGLEKPRGFVAHTFNEVFVGGRWVRLNYSTLGQNILDERLYGLLTHTLTFRDLSEANLAATWGKRYALGEKSASLPTSNPFTALEVSDLFGKHARVPNPPVKAREDHQTLTIQRIIWADSDQRPAWLALKDLRTRDPDAVVMLIRPVERFENQDYRQYRRFLDAAGREFVLKGDDGTEIPAKQTGGFYTTQKECEIALAINGNDRARMKPGVAFHLQPKNERLNAPRWAVKDDVVLKLHDN